MSRGRMLQWAALFVLLILAAALTIAALAAASPSGSTDADSPGSGSTDPAPDVVPVPSSETDPNEGPVEQIQRPTRLLVAINESGAWRSISAAMIRRRATNHQCAPSISAMRS